MSNEIELSRYEREQAQREETFNRLYSEYTVSIASQLRNDFAYFASEYEERLASHLVCDEPLLHALWKACNDSNDELAIKRLRNIFTTTVMEMATDRADYEKEMGGLDQ